MTEVRNCELSTNSYLELRFEIITNNLHFRQTNGHYYYILFPQLSQTVIVIEMVFRQCKKYTIFSLKPANSVLGKPFIFWIVPLYTEIQSFFVAKDATDMLEMCDLCSERSRVTQLTLKRTFLYQNSTKQECGSKKGSFFHKVAKTCSDRDQLLLKVPVSQFQYKVHPSGQYTRQKVVFSIYFGKSILPGAEYDFIFASL